MADQLPQLGRTVVRPHKCLADEHGVVAGLGQATGVVGVTDSRFGDGHHALRNAGAQRAGALVVDLERAQIALVDPDQSGANGQGAR